MDPARLGSSWLRKFDMRPVRGHPFVRGADPREGEARSTLGWVREVDGASLDFLTLTALCDTTFPQIFGLVRERVPISTIVMNCFFHTTSAELADIGNDYILGEATIAIAKDGYFDERTMLWSRDGRLLATTEQIVWYKALEPV
jgi:acyl-CoA thioesterase